MFSRSIVGKGKMPNFYEYYDMDLEEGKKLRIAADKKELAYNKLI
jgi:hypothetical protein